LKKCARAALPETQSLLRKPERRKKIIADAADKPPAPSCQGEDAAIFRDRPGRRAAEERTVREGVFLRGGGRRMKANMEGNPMENLILKHGLWVVVADGEKALFLKNEGDAKFPDFQVVQEMEQENRATREQGVERPGRYSDGPSAHKSAFQETDWHRLNKERFADDIAERLYKQAHAGAYDRLVIVAPPQVLGEMRRKLHKEVVGKLVAEIPKTLTNQPVWDIEKMLMAA
jgi:protein required for attachment to host cells